LSNPEQGLVPEMVYFTRHGFVHRIENRKLV
jgi:hypothetical protein